ncbi:MAG: hypothetical protein L6Q95_12065 [Planctomycetes bacterium]|nr:hypothetical protein [Planctomycetota bacterium]
MRLSRTALLIMAGAALAAAPGDLDDTFGDGGIVLTEAGGTVLSVAAQSDGKLVVAADSGTTTDEFTVARYNGDGSVDTGFGTGGFASPFASLHASFPQHVSIDGSGRILAAGHATVERTTGKGKPKTEYVRMVAIARLASDGSADTTFGTGGRVLTEVSGTSESAARGLAVQSDGKIVVAGSARVAGSKGKSANNAVLLLRYQASGVLDTTFGTGGIVVDNYTADEDLLGLNGVALQSDGKIVVAGSVGTALDSGFVRRYNTNGSLDTSFGSGGTIVINAGLSVSPSIAVDGQDRILFASGIAGDGVIARFDEDGALDTGFAASGWFETGLSGDDAVRGLAVLSGGSIAAGGQTVPVTGDGFTLRLDADGDLDTTYAGDGISDLTTDGDSDHESIFDFVVDADGDYVICGGKAGDSFLARYLGN